MQDSFVYFLKQIFKFIIQFIKPEHDRNEKFTSCSI